MGWLCENNWTEGFIVSSQRFHENAKLDFAKEYARLIKRYANFNGKKLTNVGVDSIMVVRRCASFRSFCRFIINFLFFVRFQTRMYVWKNFAVKLAPLSNIVTGNLKILFVLSRVTVKCRFNRNERVPAIVKKTIYETKKIDVKLVTLIVKIFNKIFHKTKRYAIELKLM